MGSALARLAEEEGLAPQSAPHAGSALERLAAAHQAQLAAFGLGTVEPGSPPPQRLAPTIGAPEPQGPAPGVPAMQTDVTRAVPGPSVGTPPLLVQIAAAPVASALVMRHPAIGSRISPERGFHGRVPLMGPDVPVATAETPGAIPERAFDLAATQTAANLLAPVGEAKLGELAGKAGARLFGTEAAESVLGRGVAHAAAAFPVGAGVTLAYDPEHPVRAILTGGALATLAGGAGGAMGARAELATRAAQQADADVARAFERGARRGPGGYAERFEAARGQFRPLAPLAATERETAVATEPPSPTSQALRAHQDAVAAAGARQERDRLAAEAAEQAAAARREAIANEPGSPISQAMRAHENTIAAARARRAAETAADVEVPVERAAEPEPVAPEPAAPATSQPAFLGTRPINEHEQVAEYALPDGDVAFVQHSVDNGQLHVGFFGSTGGEGSVGPGQARAIVRDLRDRTGATRVTGERISGARPGHTVRGAAPIGLVTRLATSGVGATAGGAIGSQIGDTPEERRRNALIGATIGGAAGLGLGTAAERGLSREEGAITRGLRARRGAIDLRPAAHPEPPAAEAAFRQVERGIDFTGRVERGALKASRASLSTRMQRLGDKLANGLGPIERLGERATSLAPSKNPRDLLTYVKSSSHTVKLAFTKAIIDPVTREAVAPSFTDIFTPLGSDDKLIRRALTYVKAQRDVGRGLEGVAGDEAALHAAQLVVDAGDADPVLAAFAQRWSQYIDGLRNYAVKSGLWSEALAEKITNSDALYVPYRRIRGASLEGPAHANSGRSLTNVTAGVKRFEGSTAPIANPAEALAEYTDAIIRRADRYRVGAALFDAADALGPEGELLLTRVPQRPASARPHAVRAAMQRAKQLGLDEEALEALTDAFDVRIDPENPVIWRNNPDGTREYATIHAKDLWEAVSHLNPEDPGAVRTFLDVTLRPMKHIFTATTTAANPRFALGTNPSRDIIDALAKTRVGLTPADFARGYAEALGGAAGREGLAREAERFGLSGTSLLSQDRPRPTAKRLAPVTRGQRVRRIAGKAGSAPLRAVDAIGDVSDQGPRLAEYMATVRKYGHLVDEGVWTPHDLRVRAATNGRAVTIDFHNKPGNAVLRFAGDYIPFFNAALQGTVSFGQAAARNPARVATVASAIAGSAALAWALKHRLSPDVRARINDRPATERAAFLLVPLDHLGSLLRIPLSQELGIMAAGVTAGLDALIEHDPNAGRVVVESLLRALPPGISDLAQGNITVPVPGAQQLLENAKNRKDYGGAPVVPGRLQDLPPAERRYPTTSPTFDVVAAGARKAGLSNTSPLEAENVARGIFSNATNFITAATDPIAARLNGRRAEHRLSRPLSQQPLNPASAVVTPAIPYRTESEQRYYDLRERVTEAENAVAAARRAKDTAAIPRLAREYGPLLSGHAPAVFKAADKELATIRAHEQQVRDAVGAKRITDDRARALLTQLRAERQRLYRQAMQIIEAKQ